MEFKQCWQAMLQLHLSDQQFYYLLRCHLYYRFDSIQQRCRSSLVQAMTCCMFSAKPLPEPMVIYCQLHHKEQMSRNTLWPSDDIWWQGSWSTLAQVMACCLTAPSHDGTKPLPEPMLTYRHYGPVMFIWGKFRLRYHSHQSLNLAWKLFF